VEGTTRSLDGHVVAGEPGDYGSAAAAWWAQGNRLEPVLEDRQVTFDVPELLPRHRSTSSR
jgi:hypothetical protein